MMRALSSLFPHPARRGLRWSAVAVLAAVTWACVDDGMGPTAAPSGQAAQPGMGLIFAAIADGSCTSTTNGTKQVPDGVASLVARWTANVKTASGSVDQKTGTAKATKAQAVGGKWEIKDIPATDDLQVQVYGCSADKQVVYAGSNDGIQIVAGQPQSAHIFLAPLDKPACAGSPTGAAKLSAPRSLAGSTVLPTGDVVVAGGMGKWDEATSIGGPSQALDVYESRNGHFRPLLAGGKPVQLAVGRISPHVLPLATGSGTQVLVVGGTLAAKRVGDAKLKMPVLGPPAIKDALPAIKAELVDVGANPAVAASKVDPGVGTAMLSSAVAAGNTILFVGGQNQSEQVLDSATRLTKLDDVAAGGAGVSTTVKLNSPRLKPALLTFPADDTVLVWGGVVPASGAPQTQFMGELVLGSGQAQLLTVTGDADLLAHPALSTIAPVATYVSRTTSQLTALISGGAPLGELGTDKAPTYLLTVDKASLTADLRKVSLPAGVAPSAGLFGLAVPLDGRRVLLGGGLVGLTAPLTGFCAAAGNECVLDNAWVLQVPETLPAAGAAVELKLVATVPLAGAKFGFAGAPLPLGALLAGGQQSVFAGSDAATLGDVGAVLTLTPPGLDAATICP